MVNSIEPVRVTARVYDVGFGDCMLLTFHYDKDSIPGRPERHLLVDFGSTRYPFTGFKMSIVRELIEQQIDGVLDVLIATHRHKDHVSGFDAKFAGAEIDNLNPRLVIRPWPDHPDATEARHGPVGIRDADREFVRTLKGAHVFAAAAEREFAGQRAAAPKSLHYLAQMSIANAASISNLERWAKATEARYVVGPDLVDLDKYIPGVTFDVLGPPTLANAPNLNSQRANDKDEYWFRNAKKLAKEIGDQRGFSDDIFDRLAEPDGIGAAAWIIRRLERRSVAQLLQIIRSFDDALNNTSVVGVLNAGKTSILISGDAQIENWDHTLKRIDPENELYEKQLRENLANVTLYKVGHHGSRNGTPISLHSLWASDVRDRRRTMTILNSTKSGVHGHSAATAVPNRRLVRALGGTDTPSELTLDKVRYYSTEDLRGRHPEDPEKEQNYRAWKGTTSRQSGVFARFDPETAY